MKHLHASEIRAVPHSATHGSCLEWCTYPRAAAAATAYAHIQVTSHTYRAARTKNRWKLSVISKAVPDLEPAKTVYACTDEHEPEKKLEDDYRHHASLHIGWRRISPKRMQLLINIKRSVEQTIREGGYAYLLTPRSLSSGNALSLSETTGEAVGQGMARPGSSKRTPPSAWGAYGESTL